MRVAIDTNVLVSAVATRGLCADVSLVLAEHQLIAGATVLANVRRVLRQKITADKDLLEVVGKILLAVPTPRGLWERLREGTSASQC